MPDVYFNKSPKKRPSNDDYEDISSFSSKSAKRRSDVEFQRARARAEAEAYENGYYDDYSEYDERDLKKARKKAKKAAKKEQKANRPRRRGGCGSAFLSLFLILVILYLAMSTVFLARMDYEPDQHKSNSHISSFSLKKSPLITNILLLGVDNREGETGFQRADTMMLISIDNLHQKIKFTSFLRDSYVEIPGHGMMKLNAASSLGGIQLTIDTIEYNYKVKINKYMEVDFNAFTAIIDALGGVDVPVTAKEAAYLNSTWYKWSLTGNRIYFESGDSVHMDGEHALMFSRIRKLDSDIQRTRRQRLVVNAIRQKAADAKPSDLAKAAWDVLPYLRTDMGGIKTSNLAIGSLLLYRHYDILQTTAPRTDTWTNRNIPNVGAVLYFDVDQNATILKNYIYRDEYDENYVSTGL